MGSQALLRLSIKRVYLSNATRRDTVEVSRRHCALAWRQLAPLSLMGSQGSEREWSVNVSQTRFVPGCSCRFEPQQWGHDDRRQGSSLVAVSVSGSLTGREICLDKKPVQSG
jgi:hypothetical protein